MDPRDLLAPKREYHRVGRGFQVDTSRVRAARHDVRTRPRDRSPHRGCDRVPNAGPETTRPRTSTTRERRRARGVRSTPGRIPPATHSISGCRIAIRESRLVWSSRSQNRRTTSTFSSDIAHAVSRGYWAGPLSMESAAFRPKRLFRLTHRQPLRLPLSRDCRSANDGIAVHVHPPWGRPFTQTAGTGRRSSTSTLSTENPPSRSRSASSFPRSWARSGAEWRASQKM